MNRNLAGVSPKNSTPSCPNTSTIDYSYSTLKTKNVSPSTTTSTPSYKSPYKAKSFLQSNKNALIADNDRYTRGPSSSTINHTPRSTTKTSLPSSTQTVPNSDNNKLNTNAICPYTDINTFTNDQPINDLSYTTNNNINFASAVAM
ncbi:Hypothetical protein CINCED_3A019025 [Cinara cedri]|uniref:Uncharacterized protein n=1 Tax=Cinara cedri TaxID=506608 RepID=A0A5E4NJT4_9HEMI|nr:Hypothetical protein CINCED_3A019025 [Cinara cedri]